ncbi:preprotein translocase subunit SecE [methane-oxidizing endosymbiont of Gigantopelta aegis]|uniref:preprotein translocase subunit SecE n=1 Tax=methane-oxidizing endosymbiont of Gigantopelta aegis TaxID=2794938 RepID=UPI0018DDEA71|nr:preprotein translocase subunit SecE [methane-oxidizing endosymbiont of Gigantopelta aegis]
MNAQAEDTAESSVLDILKHVLVAALVVGAIGAFYYYSEFSLLYRVLALVAVMVISAGIFLTTSVGKSLWVFMLEAKQEVRKVVWPTREETMRTTLLVFGMVFIVGFILWLLDMFLFWGVKLLTGQGG